MCLIQLMVAIVNCSSSIVPEKKVQGKAGDPRASAYCAENKVVNRIISHKNSK